MIDSPAVNVTFLRQGHAKAVTNGDLEYLASNFLNPIRSQKLSECPRAPQEQVALLGRFLRDRSTETSSCDKTHGYVRNFVDELHAILLFSRSISQLACSVFSTRVHQTCMRHHKRMVLSTGHLLTTIDEARDSLGAQHVEIRRIDHIES